MQKQNNNKTITKKYPTGSRTGSIATSKGFSLIELLVVMSIMLIMTTAILFRQTKFSSDILITNVAYEIALAIREAEIYGVSGKTSFDQVNNVETNKVGYGIHLEMNADGSPTRTYTEFIDNAIGLDAGGENMYDYFLTGSDHIVSVPEMSQGDIKRFCGVVGPANSKCFESGGAGTLNVVFVKPDPEANIRIGDDKTSLDGATNYSSAIIVVESALGDKCRTVRISNSGQVSVDPISGVEEDGGCGKTE